MLNTFDTPQMMHKPQWYGAQYDGNRTYEKVAIKRFRHIENKNVKFLLKLYFKQFFQYLQVPG